MRNSPAGAAGLAHQLRQALTPTPFTTGWIQWGTVHAVNTAPRTVDLYLDGATTVTPGIRYLGWWAPAVGETIPVLRGPKGLQTDRIALGTLSKAAPTPGGGGLITAETSSTGVALIGASQTILTVLIPSDGKVHQVILTAAVYVTAALTGGAVQTTFTAYPGTSVRHTFTTTTVGTRMYSSTTTAQTLVKPGTRVSVKQTTAMTAGAAKVYAKIVVI
jgi:hypothetical protein